ncbi:levodione reductase [Candidatus Phycosocius bacilliformis]|uniref:D-xylose 1-dehydrogenase n=1 Tax=Candidatus Phycosocius bacilliformis TaxID=1445552 RepID=A0A2P2EA68_9PROT|nr:SDR family NAD(P)-dependent oxidoreductase [Candidatus Phycosocius bacilliformis]GBF57950.1 levodione reductase [Candidatus Phycosocius bacilliformis]
MANTNLGLLGRVAMITGAARGIGRAALHRMIDEGVHVLAWDVDPAWAEELKTIPTPDHVQIRAFIGDVCESLAWQQAVASALDHFGRLDFLFSNAGISGPAQPVSRYEEADFDRVMAINARGVYLGLKYVGQHLSQQGRGVIVNVASISGLGGGGNIFAYTASKHAVIGMTKSAAVHYAPLGVRVVAVCPSPTDTDMMAYAERAVMPDNPQAARPIFTQGIPMGRYAQPDEIASVFAFLISEQASFLTGTIVPVDGGCMAR